MATLTTALVAPDGVTPAVATLTVRITTTDGTLLDQATHRVLGGPAEIPANGTWEAPDLTAGGITPSGAVYAIATSYMGTFRGRTWYWDGHADATLDELPTTAPGVTTPAIEAYDDTDLAARVTELEQNGGGGGGPVEWTDVEDKPATFPPTAHQHPATDVTGLAAVATSGAYGDLSGKPTIPTTPGQVGADAAGAAALAQAAAQAYTDAKDADLTALINLAEESDDIADLAAAVQALADAPPDVTQAELDAEAASRAAGDTNAVTAAAADATTKANAAQSAAVTAATTAAATDATNKVNAHVAATDPHGDRAWATAQLATKLATADAPRSATPPPLTVVSEMETGWVDNDARGTIGVDNSVFVSGAGSLKYLMPTGTGSVAARLTFTAQDWTDNGLRIRLRSDDWANLNDLYMLVSTSGVFTSHFITPFLRSTIQRTTDGEWMDFTLTPSDFDPGAGTPDWSTVNGLMIRAYSNNGVTPSLWIDRIDRYTSRGKAIISVVFDDSYATDYTVARPKLQQYGFRGTHFVIPDQIGNTGYLTQAQVDLLADAGDDISGHGDPRLDTMTLAAAEAEVRRTRRYLSTRGYKGQDNFAYPLGGQNLAVRRMMGRYWRLVRGTSSTGQKPYHHVRMNLTCRQVGNVNTTTQVQGWIDDAIATGDWLILVFHRLITPKVLDEDTTPTDFATTIDYLAGRVTAGLLDVLPVSEIGQPFQTDPNTQPTGTIDLTAAETQAIGDAVQINSAGRAHLAKADAIANASTLLLCALPITGVARTTYLLPGQSLQLPSSPGWTVGGTVYLSTTGTTGNTLTQTPPAGAGNVVQVIGVALAADTLLFLPSLVQVEHV